MPFFSIIIPAYNSGKVLRKCLESIVNQSFSDFEILIMDGISTDDTLKIIESFKDFRIKIYSEEDKGIYDAINKGVDVSSGEWLYFIGSDDELYNNNVLGEIYSIAKATNEKIIYGNVKVKGDTGWAKDGDIYDGEFNLQKLLKKNISHQAVFYHQSVYKKIGRYNIKYTICADWDFNLRCFAKYKFKYVSIIVAIFQGGNTSTKGDDIFRKDKALNILKYFKGCLYKKEFFLYLKDKINSKNK